MANFMSTVMGNIAFDPSRLVLTGGATPAIEILAFCLGNPGDAFLIPAPYYSGFDRDLERTLTIEEVEHAYNKARDQGLNICGILFSNPSNPAGNLVPRETLHCLLEFAREKNIHIISDEIFAGSVHGNGEFISMAEIVKGNDLDKDRVHTIYGLSKDFSLAGFRIGSIYTLNEAVLKAAKRMTRFCSTSTVTQRLLIKMLSDEGFVKEYLEIYRKRLKKMHDLFVSGMERIGIQCSKSDAGLFRTDQVQRCERRDGFVG